MENFDADSGQVTLRNYLDFLDAGELVRARYELTHHGEVAARGEVDQTDAGGGDFRAYRHGGTHCSAHPVD